MITRSCTLVPDNMITARAAKRTQPRAHRPLLADEQGARILAICQSAPPTGKTRWTLRMVMHRTIGLEIVPALSPEAARRMLKKRLQLSLIQQWGAALSHSARDAERMEAVLAVYRRPIDPRLPVICFDESGKE